MSLTIPVLCVPDAFSLHFDDSIGSVSGLGPGVFIPKGVNSKCDISAFVVLVPIGVESKGGRPIDVQIPCFLSKFETKFYSYIHGLTLPH